MQPLCQSGTSRHRCTEPPCPWTESALGGTPRYGPDLFDAHSVKIIIANEKALQFQLVVPVDLFVSSKFQIQDFSKLEESLESKAGEVLQSIYSSQQLLQANQGGSVGQVPSAKVLLKFKVKGQTTDVHLRQAQQRWQG